MTDRTALSTGSSDTGGLFFKKQSKDSTPVMSQSDFNGGLKQPLMQKMPKMMMPGFLKSGSTSAKNLFQHQLDKATGGSNSPGFHGISTSMIMATPPNTPNMFSAAAVHAPNSVQQSLCVNSEFTVPETPVNAKPSNGTGKMLASPPPSDDSLLGASPENSTTSADTKGQLNNMIRLFSTYQQEMDRKDSLIAAKESELREARATERLLQDSIQNYRDRVHELNVAIDDLRKQQEEAHVMFSKLEEQYQLNKERLAQAEMDLGNKHNDFESMRKEKHDIDCQLADINSKHEILRSERDQIDLKFDDKLKEWEHEKIELIRCNQKSEADLAALSAKLATSEANWSALIEKERQLFELEKERLKDVVDGLKPENQNLKEKIAVLECELKDCVRKLSQSEDSCQKLRLDLKEQIQRSISADEMKTLLAMKETELADTDSLDGAIEDKRAIEMELEKLKERSGHNDKLTEILQYFESIGAKVELLDTVKEAIDNLTNNIQSASIDIKEAHLQRIIDAKEREVVLLREELEMAKKTIADCRSAADQSKSMSELSAVVSDLLLRMNDLSSGDGELAARFKQLQDEFYVIKEEKESWITVKHQMIDEIGKLKEASVQEGKKWKEVILKYQADLKQAESQITYLTKQRDDVLNERAANKNNKSSLSVNVDEDNAEDTIMLEAMNNLEQEIKQKQNGSHAICFADSSLVSSSSVGSQLKGKEPLVDALMRRARTYTRQNSLSKRKADGDDEDHDGNCETFSNPTVFQTKISSLSTKKRRRGAK